MTLVKTLQDSPGFTAIIVLAVLTLVEYLVSAGDIAASFVILLAIAIAKGAIILVSFMHLTNIFGTRT